MNSNNSLREKRTAEPISFSSRIFDFFAQFRPSKFELDIIKFYRSALDKDSAQILDTQMASFNRMRRFVNYEISFVVFAHSKTKLLMAVPKINNHLGARDVAVTRAVCDDGNEIKRILVTYDGVIYKIKFSSNKDDCYPRSNYFFDKMKLL